MLFRSLILPSGATAQTVTPATSKVGSVELRPAPTAGTYRLIVDPASEKTGVYAIYLQATGTTPTGLELSAISASPTNRTDLIFRLAGPDGLNCGTVASTDLSITRGSYAGVSSSGSSCLIEVTSSVGAGTTNGTSVVASATFSVTEIGRAHV